MKYYPVIRIFVVLFFTVAAYIFITDAGEWTSMLDISSLTSFLNADHFVASN